MGGREGDDDVVEKVLWFSKGKTFRKMIESFTSMLYFKHVHDCSCSEYSREILPGLFWYRIFVGSSSQLNTSVGWDLHGLQERYRLE